MSDRRDRPNHRRCEVHLVGGVVAVATADSETGESLVQHLLRTGFEDGGWLKINGAIINLDNVTIIREVGR